MAALSSDEERRLRLFSERVKDLRDCGVVKQGEVKLKVQFPLGKSVEDSEEVPFVGFDRDHFRSAMQTLRQFMLNDDEISFFRICKTIRRRCDREDLKEWAAYSRSFWKKTLETTPLSFRVGNKSYNVKSAIDLMLYGFLSHTKSDPAEEWERLSPGGKATIYFIVQRSLFDLFYCLNLIDSVILYWLDQPDTDVPKLGDVQCSDGESTGDEDTEHGG